MSHSIVLAHEESGFAQSVQAALEAEGHTVDVYATGQPALDAVSASPPDLLIFGIVPDMEGLSALRDLRATGNTRDQRIMWIMPTQSDAAIKQAWDGGADCVLNPPASVAEVVCLTGWLFNPLDLSKIAAP